MFETHVSRRYKYVLHIFDCIQPQLTAMKPFDLTELDWTAELWIAVHDDDEQNARLARHVWEDNGLDVPEKFLEGLQMYLGKQTANMRRTLLISVT